MGRITELRDKVFNLEMFMIAVCNKLGCLPDFNDYLPEKGNLHVIEKLDALLKHKESVNSGKSVPALRGEQ